MKKITLVAAFLSLLLLLGGCTQGKSVTVGTQTFTETKILGYMYKYLIEDRSDINVDVKTDLLSSPFVINAIKENEIQMGTAYTGEIFNGWFPVKPSKDPQNVLEQAKKGFDKHYGITWMDPLGFENTYAFTVRKDVAEKYNLKKISDLKGISQDMKLGVDTAWLERKDDGYDAFSKTYGLTFGQLNPMEINLVYTAVQSKDVDIVLAYSSDPRIEEFNLVTLEDDRKFFPPYLASPIVLKETLKQYPEIEPALKPLIGKIDLDTIRMLNAEVDLKKRDPKDVAKEFLEKQGLLKRR
ncbi:MULTISPECIES: glycine betaine ABC transporter substrate-binding protein [Aneurinibacillus]|jgi:osmoprotectant transport system substrate-binding protein|uniref:Choline-binding protein n=1 Tax=Aneurinibacillus danicus TaxID=267746 RepID=A0A511V6X8_9BACL|nr:MULTISPECIES: glycine betaine ABC transporter substrate-binding protein [Aneurinibacillus]GEN34529.1 choline-binding protein [Aneurinibacillus danicus]